MSSHCHENGFDLIDFLKGSWGFQAFLEDTLRTTDPGPPK